MCQPCDQPLSGSRPWGAVSTSGEVWSDTLGTTVSRNFVPNRSFFMFPLEASGKPGRDYPRIGPSFCTKWFEPSILPGPVLPSWTTSQPCSIDAGGSIFLQGGGGGDVSEFHGNQKKGAHINTADRNRPPLAGAKSARAMRTNRLSTGGESERAQRATHISAECRRKCSASGGGTLNPGSGGGGNRSGNRLDNTGGGQNARARQANRLSKNPRSPLAGGDNKRRTNRLSTEECRRKCPVSCTPNPGGSDGGNKGDSSSRRDTASGNSRGANVLHHAGGIVRCRPVYYADSRTPTPAINRRSSAANTDTAVDMDNSAVAPARAKLRAYSAPLFLHSTTFPPTSRTHAACGMVPATAARDDDDDNLRRYQTPASSKGGRASATATNGDDDLRRDQTSRLNRRSRGCRARTSQGDRRQEDSVSAAAVSESRTHSTGGTVQPVNSVGHDDADDGLRRCQSPTTSNITGRRCRAHTSHEGRRKHEGNARRTRRQREEKTHRGSRQHEERPASVPAGVGVAGPAGPAGPAGAAPGRHRNAGYLHRYMGFVQEKVSSPALESFRVSGGLRDFPRKDSTAAAGKAVNGHDDVADVNPATEEEGAAREPGGRRRCSRGNSERSYEGTRSAAGGGAKLQKSWGADGGKGHHHPTKDAPRKKPAGSSTSRMACKANIASRKRRVGSPYHLGVLLPYDLERPVSPERGEAFHFTCN